MKPNKKFLIGMAALGLLINASSPLFAESETYENVTRVSDMVISNDNNSEKKVLPPTPFEHPAIEFISIPSTTVKFGQCMNTYGQSPTFAQGSTDHGGQIEIGSMTNIIRCQVLFSKSYSMPPFCVVTSENSNFDSPFALPPIDIVTTSAGFTVQRRGGVTMEMNEKVNYICMERGK
jgi:hypothetical protein